MGAGRKVGVIRSTTEYKVYFAFDSIEVVKSGKPFSFFLFSSSFFFLSSFFYHLFIYLFHLFTILCSGHHCQNPPPSALRKLSQKPLGFISGPTPKAHVIGLTAIRRLPCSLESCSAPSRGSASVTTPPQQHWSPSKQPSNLQPAALHLFISCTTTTAFHCCPCVRSISHTCVPNLPFSLRPPPQPDYC